MCKLSSINMQGGYTLYFLFSIICYLVFFTHDCFIFTQPLLIHFINNAFRLRLLFSAIFISAHIISNLPAYGLISIQYIPVPQLTLSPAVVLDKFLY